MSYQATVLPVMIASLGDVGEERRIVRDILHQWNDIHAAYRGIVLLPVGWETNSAPELGDRPQSQINERLLAECDLLIGIFGTKLGTPTGNYESGTVEEIDRHADAGKPAMLYFLDCKDRLEGAALKEHRRIQMYRESCMPRGLVESYKDLEEFRHKLTRQVQHCLNDNLYLKEILSQQQPNMVFAPDQAPKQSLDPISPNAIELVKAAASGGGDIHISVGVDAREIDAGEQHFGGIDRREYARWESALNELVQNDLVLQRSEKLYDLTSKGWALAE